MKRNTCRSPAPICLPLGRIVATPGALDCLERHAANAAALLWRHQHGDWGELSPEDWQQNDRSATQGMRVLSNYPLASHERLWVITEADRSVTTLLLPSEY